MESSSDWRASLTPEILEKRVREHNLGRWTIFDCCCCDCCRCEFVFEVQRVACKCHDIVKVYHNDGGCGSPRDSNFQDVLEHIRSEYDPKRIENFKRIWYD